MKRIAMGVFALTMALGFAGAAQSQVVCSKTNNKGKTKFKLRDVCKSNEVVAQDFATLVPADVVTESELRAPPGQLATVTDVANVPRTQVHAFDADSELVFLTTTFSSVPLNGAATSVDVATTAASTDLVITFNAECGGQATGGWVDVDVKVDGTILGSTDQSGDDAFCMVDYATHSVTVVALDVGPGVHVVTVDALETSESSGSLDDIGITIIAVED